MQEDNLAVLARTLRKDKLQGLARADFEIISSRFDLTAEVEDIVNIDSIFGTLDARGLDGLTQGDIDDLIEFSENKGHSSSMARSILMHIGYRFETKRGI